MLRLTLRLELSLSNPPSFQTLKTQEIWTTTSNFLLNDFSVNHGGTLQCADVIRTVATG